MAVVKELIRTEENGTISFGDYEKNQKSKVSDYPHQGDMYKVKTFKEITKLERNGMFVYESVPGTAVFNLAQDGNQMSFRVEVIPLIFTFQLVEGFDKLIYEILFWIILQWVCV